MASTYSTWEYYRDSFHGTLADADYARMAGKAAGEINARTFGRAPAAPAEMEGHLQDCECELVDALFSFDQSYSLLPQGISSINNDGLSVATSAGNSRSDSRESLQEAKLQGICRKYLLMPVNLLYRGGAAVLSFDTTITIYNTLFNSETGHNDYFRTLVYSCSWYGRLKADRSGDGLAEDKAFKVRIADDYSRSDKAFVHPEDFTDPTSQYTLDAGVIILQGEGPPAPTTGEELAALTAGRTEGFRVLDWRDNRRVGIRHLYVEGK